MSHQNHISFKKGFLRMLLGLILSAGFLAFWVAIIFGIKKNLLLFVVGILVMILGVYHMWLAIKKQKHYHDLNKEKRNKQFSKQDRKNKRFTKKNGSNKKKKDRYNGQKRYAKKAPHRRR